VAAESCSFGNFTATFERAFRASPKILLTIRASNVTWEDFRSMYRFLQQQRKKRADLIDDTDEAIYFAVQRAGGVPKKGKTDFWLRILEEVEPPGIKTWQGIRKRYFNLIRKKLPLTGASSRVSHAHASEGLWISSQRES
jgi:hypothetical protein